MSAPAQPSILVIDDEVQIRRLMRFALEGGGYRVLEAATGQLGLSEAAAAQMDGVVLDLGLPDMDGTAVVRRLREWSKVPVLILSVRAGEEDKISALDAGADDYLTKPFSTRELLARLRALLRRTQPAPGSAVVAFGEIEVDLTSRLVRRGGAEVKLTSKEYALLSLLVQHRGRVITHRQILRELWGPHAEESTHYLRVQMTHLRKKLEAVPQQPRHLKTESGIGYRLVEA
jgi:two-component system KDP operon response regulator KdpE